MNDQPIVLGSREKFSYEELGLLDSLGRAKGGAFDLLSKNKAPGPNN